MGRPRRFVPTCRLRRMPWSIRRVTTSRLTTRRARRDAPTASLEGFQPPMIPASYLPPIPQPPHDPRSWLLNARLGWKGATLLGVESRPGDGALALEPLAGSGPSLLDASGSFGGLRPPANVAIGPGGEIYLLDRATLRLRQFEPCACGFVDVPCFGGEGSGSRQLCDPHGIAIRGGSLFVCDTGNQRLVVVGLDRLVPQGLERPPASTALGQPWEPYAIA